MGSSTFSPTSLTVTIGTTVTWKNDSGITHNVNWNDATGRSAAGAGDGTGDIGDFSSGSHTRMFNTPGTYAFYCNIHGTPTSGMTGTLTVQ
jgi:plastocyanin